MTLEEADWSRYTVTVGTTVDGQALWQDPVALLVTKEGADRRQARPDSRHHVQRPKASAPASDSCGGQKVTMKVFRASAHQTWAIGVANQDRACVDHGPQSCRRWGSEGVKGSCASRSSC